jgi:hypothetical protein
MTAPLASLALVAALAGCMTDVSTPSAFGTQGYVVAWVSPGESIRAIVPETNGVYYAGLNFINHCPREGCTGDTQHELVYRTEGVANTGGGGNIARVAYDEARIYWTEILGTTSGGRLVSCDPDACAESQVEHYADLDMILNPKGANDLGFLAVDAGSLYWTGSVISSAGGTAARLYTIPSGALTPSPTPAWFHIPNEFTPLFVHAGSLYGTLATAHGAALASCRLTPTPACDTQVVLVDETVYQVLSAGFFGNTLYFDAEVANTFDQSVYACTPSCDQPAFVYPSLWPSFAIDGARVYSGAFLTLPAYEPFGTCLLGSTCVGGPQRLDLAFAPLPLFGNGTAMDVVLDPQGGAYAFGGFIPPDGADGLATPLGAIVHLPPP